MQNGAPPIMATIPNLNLPDLFCITVRKLPDEDSNPSAESESGDGI